MFTLLYHLHCRTRRLVDWIARRFTPAGQFLLVALTAASFLATNVEQTYGYQAFFLLAAVLFLALLHLPFFRGRFGMDRILPRYATVGEPFTYRVRIHNPGRHPQRQLEYLEQLPPQPPSLSEFRNRLRPGKRNRAFRVSDPLPSLRHAAARPTPLAPIPAGGHVEIRPELLPLKRGTLHLRGAWIARQDTLGLCRSLVRLAQPQTLLVLPRRYPLPPLTLPGHTRYQRGGVTFASGIGESEEFVSLRDYRRGDSLKHIHWRSSARVGTLVVREFQDEFFVRHALILDTFCDPSLDDLFEDAVAVAASFACTVPDQESLLDLLFVGPRAICVTAGRGVGQTHRMLEALAVAQPCREPRFPDLRTLVLRHGRRLSGAILVGLEWDAPRRDLIRQLKALNVPTLVIVLRPPGEREPFDRGPAADQPDRLVVVESGRVAEALRQL